MTKRKSIIICFLLLAAATASGYLFRMMGHMDTNVVIAYMLSVLLAASITDGFFYGILQAFLAMMAFNYFFVTPYYSFDVDNPSHATAMVMMLFAAIITSMITSRKKMSEREAREREEETVSLLKLTNRVCEAHTAGEIAENVVKYAGSSVRCNMSCVIADDDGRLCGEMVRRTDSGELVWEEIRNKAVLEELFLKPQKEEYLDGPIYRNWPVYGQSGLLGVIRIPLTEVGKMTQTQRRILVSVKETARLAMDRLCALRRQMRDNALIEKERYRSTLLRSISHDLRTPLAGIMGTAEILLDMTEKTDHKRELLENISQDAQWLYELVENVLSLTRLLGGGLLHREPEACEEVIETAVRRIQSRSGKREIAVCMPTECLVVDMDARLVEQVLVNMLDNAVKHTPEDGKIHILVSSKDAEVEFSVLDNGSGILPQDLPYIFELFYSAHGENTDKTKGTGIGLAICEAVVKAHGGKISAKNREDGNGAVFSFTIPQEYNNREEWNTDAEEEDTYRGG